MSERISVDGIHKKCGQKKLFRSVGGDLMFWCDYCNEQLSDPKKEILTEDEYSQNFHLWREDLEKEED